MARAHGTSQSGQSLTGGLNYYTVRTLLDITYSSDRDPNDESQARMDKLIETISLRAQPVIRGNVTVTSEAKADIEDLPAAAAASGTNVNVYTFSFSIEHNQAWEVTGNNPTLEESLNGIAGFVFEYPTTNNNIAITMHPSIR